MVVGEINRMDSRDLIFVRRRAPNDPVRARKY